MKNQSQIMKKYYTASGKHKPLCRYRLNPYFKCDCGFGGKKNKCPDCGSSDIHMMPCPHHDPELDVPGNWSRIKKQSKPMQNKTKMHRLDQKPTRTFNGHGVGVDKNILTRIVEYSMKKFKPTYKKLGGLVPAVENSERRNEPQILTKVVPSPSDLLRSKMVKWEYDKRFMDDGKNKCEHCFCMWEWVNGKYHKICCMCNTRKLSDDYSKT